MEDKKVAGTVMLHLQNGSKKFLMHSVGDTIELAYTKFSNDRTGLANILQLLKDTAHLDVNNLNLVELTNGHIDEENIPLFVFEAEEAKLVGLLPDDYHWEDPERFQKIIEDYAIEGVPFF
ncbi:MULTISPECIES: hypothetical protein [Enterococcus]|uniref:hypothetical protein n=1 Tax=Enterococcus TaxID=1350 RepID=UPI00065E8BD5|nr:MULTISPECIES: hypothetical protein [Enterococcus]KAF1302944.1 hypothetical protein BAU16_05570 [Enterococcus sp. JM9B]